MIKSKNVWSLILPVLTAACAPPKPAQEPEFAGPPPVVVSNPDTELTWVYPPYLIIERGSPPQAMSVLQDGVSRRFDVPWEVVLTSFGLIVADCIEYETPQVGDPIKMANWAFVARLRHPDKILADGVRIRVGEQAHWSLTYQHGQPLLNGQELPVGDFWADLHQDGSFRLEAYKRGSRRGVCPPVNE